MWKPEGTEQNRYKRRCFPATNWPPYVLRWDRRGAPGVWRPAAPLPSASRPRCPRWARAAAPSLFGCFCLKASCLSAKQAPVGPRSRLTRTLLGVRRRVSVPRPETGDALGGSGTLEGSGLWAAALPPPCLSLMCPGPCPPTGCGEAGKAGSPSQYPPAVPQPARQGPSVSMTTLRT